MQQRCVDVVLAFLCVFELPPTAPALGHQPLRKNLQETLGAQAWKPPAQHVGKRGSLGEEEAAHWRLFASLSREGPCSLPQRKSSISARRPYMPESWPRCFSALGDPGKDFPHFKRSWPGRRRFRECGRRAWRLPGLSTTPAFPFYLGPRPTC